MSVFYVTIVSKISGMLCAVAAVVIILNFHW